MHQRWNLCVSLMLLFFALSNAGPQRVKRSMPSSQDCDNSGAGSTYKIWGRETCPDTSSLIYSGLMGMSNNGHAGGVNYLCLPMDPEFPDDVEAGTQNGAYIYGVEYQPWYSRRFFRPLASLEAPCAVCEVQGRSLALMIPAKKTCPTGWTQEYEGLLASHHHNHKGSSDFACVASGMEARNNSNTANNPGGMLHVVEARCGGSLPCDPYPEGYELTCAVCTK